MSTPPSAAAIGTAPVQTGNLKRNALGTAGMVFLVVSAAAPLTVMAGVAPLAVLIGGTGAPAAYLAAGLVLSLFAVGFMSMTKYVRATGGFYSYISKALGPSAGLASAIIAVVSYNALQIGLYGLLGQQAAAMLSAVFGIETPWWVPALVGIGLVWALGYRGVDVGAKVLGILLAAETLILLVLAIAVVVQGGATGLSAPDFSPEGLFNPGMGAILGFALAAFMGFESTTLYREEARDPNRTIPKATYISVIFMALFYAFILWAVIQAFGNEGVVAAAAEDPAGLFFSAIRTYVGPWAETAMFIMMVTSVYAAQLAFHNAINRYTLTLARDGVLPPVLGRIHPTLASPYMAGGGQTILALVVVVVFAVMGADPYLQLVLWVNGPGAIGIIALQCIASIAVAAFFLRHPQLQRKWYVVPSAVISAVAMFAAVCLLYSTIEQQTMGGPTVNAIVLSIVPASALVGLGLALYIRTRNPHIWSRIVDREVVDGAERSPDHAGTAG